MFFTSLNGARPGRQTSLRRSWMICLPLLLFADAARLQAVSDLSRTVSFRNEVMAVLSKAGCNAGTCHGNRNGKGGFALSLRGQDPADDHKALTRDLFGRRLNRIQPEDSLLLLKPITAIAHEGGKRFGVGSPEYTLLRRWIEQGTPNDLPSAPRLVSIHVSPAEKVLIEPEAEVQLTVHARFSDGEVRDVTGLAVFETSSPKATLAADGLVRARAPAEVTILVRYLDRQIPVPLTFVPSRPGFVWSEPPENNYIDEHVFSKLRALRMNPSGLCTDDVFLRRAYLDLIGLLPSRDEAREFIADESSDKRQRLVERLFERPEFADFWALKWADLLRAEAHSLDRKGVQNFHHWIRRNIARNTPLDAFVRELVSARGSTYTHPEANYYRPTRDPATRARAVAQVFLGTRLQCAQCHNHPFDRWTQNDYYDWAGVFARVDYKVLRNDRDIGSDRRAALWHPRASSGARRAKEDSLGCLQPA